MALLMLLASYSAKADCQGLVLYSLKGDPNQPEDSTSAVRSALSGKWDGVAIDVQQLRDSQWVVHSDLDLGRTTSLARRRVSDVDSVAWREIRLKNRTGKVTTEPAPFLGVTLQAVADMDYKVVNAEIKQLYAGCEAGQQAVGAMQQGRPTGQWFLTSADRRHLQCVRRFDPKGYVGLVVVDNQAVARSERRPAGQSNATVSPNIDIAWLRRLQQEMAPPVGIHIETNTLAANANLLADAKSLGIPVFTYHLGTDREHVLALQQTASRTGLWPSGAAITGSATDFCEQLLKQ